jgi:hypothetical protein
MLAPKRLYALVAVVLALVLTACGGGGEEPAARPGKERDKACQEALPFKFGSVPTGFSKTLNKGPAPRLDAVKDTVVYHMLGPEGKYIEVFRGGQRHKIKKSKRVVVLGRAGRINKFDGGTALRFRLGRGRCSAYQVEGRALSETDVRKIAAGITR